ncbi:MAG: metal-dependent hydrolase [Pseudomonadota bacterium]
MDPITHLTSGVLTAQAVRPSTHNRWFFLFCIIGSLIPDIDNLAGLIGPEFYLIHHRGITHSLLGGLAMSFLLAFGYVALNRSSSFKRSLAVASFLIALHIFLDIITSYGTQIFYPFSRFRYELASVFIVDPVYTLSLIGVLASSFAFKRNRARIAVLGLVWLVIYPAIGYAFRYQIQNRIEREIRENGLDYQQVHVIPEALSPIQWKVILEDRHYYYLGNTRLMGKNDQIQYERYQKADLALLKTFGEKVSFFKTYAWFALYPVMKITNQDAHTMVTFGDLRFISTLSFLKNRTQKNGLPFSLSALLDDDRNLVGFTYRKPGGAQIIQHLE